VHAQLRVHTDLGKRWDLWGGWQMGSSCGIMTVLSTDTWTEGTTGATARCNGSRAGLWYVCCCRPAAGGSLHVPSSWSAW
jgi:hypothetical protein